MDLFNDFAAFAMLIGEESEAFDSEEYIYELKLDGERCLAYLGPDVIELRNKRNNKLLDKFPELKEINKQVSKNCILDGELTVMVNGAPSFSALLSRTLMQGGGFKAQLASEKHPAGFTAFDILYYDGKAVTELPLHERKKLLKKAVKENERIAVSRYIETQGKAFYELAKKNALEGIVAKRKDSQYIMGKRTKDWIKIKNMLDDDFVIVGWIPKAHSMNSIVLAQYKSGKPVYKGHVTLGVAGADFKAIQRQAEASCPFKDCPKGNENANWIKPTLVCTVKFMQRTANGGMRQPVFKGLRKDKKPRECLEYTK